MIKLSNSGANNDKKGKFFFEQLLQELSHLLWGQTKLLPSWPEGSLETRKDPEMAAMAWLITHIFTRVPPFSSTGQKNPNMIVLEAISPM